MQFLTSPEDYIGLYTPEQFGVATQDDLRSKIRESIERAYLTLRKTVPKSTYDEAVSALASDVATDDQRSLKWAEYWLVRYDLEIAKRNSDATRERAGSLEISRDPRASASLANRYLAKAIQFLNRAGFDWYGGDLVAGVRGGDPLPPREPWFDW